MAKGNITIENARIGFKNFSGAPGKFNREGDRNFCVFLEQDLAEKLVEDGWNIRWLTPKDEDDLLIPYLPVKVRYTNDITKKKHNPKIVLVSSKGKTILDENTINMLDWAETTNVDIMIRPYNWGPINGKSGVTAYVKSMYLTLYEDALELKYADIQDSAKNTLPIDDA